MTDRSRRGVEIALITLAVLAVLYTVHIAREVLLPITLAFILALLLRPLVARLSNWRIPRALSALLLITLAVAVIGGGLYGLSSSALDWLQKLPQAQSTIQEHLSGVQREVAEVDAAARNLEALADGVARQQGEVQAQPTVVVQQSWRAEIWLALRNFVMFGALSVILLFFLLVSGDQLLQRVVERLPAPEGRRRALEMAEKAQAKMSRYLVTVTAVNATVGLVTGLLLWLLDFPDPALWGTVAAALRFVPYLGVSLTVVLLGIVAATTYANPVFIVGIPLGYLLLTSLVGQVVDPLVHGFRFSLNPIIVFVWIFFWGWLWGAPGVLLAVPLLTLVQVLCQHSDRLSHIAHIIGETE